MGCHRGLKHIYTLQWCMNQWLLMVQTLKFSVIWIFHWITRSRINIWLTHWTASLLLSVVKFCVLEDYESWILLLLVACLYDCVMWGVFRHPCCLMQNPVGNTGLEAFKMLVDSRIVVSQLMAILNKWLLNRICLSLYTFPTLLGILI